MDRILDFWDRFLPALKDQSIQLDSAHMNSCSAHPTSQLGLAKYIAQNPDRNADTDQTKWVPLCRARAAVPSHQFDGRALADQAGRVDAGVTRENFGRRS